MKQFSKSLPWVALAFGGLGYGLYQWLMSTESEKGFIDKFHISVTLLLVLIGVMVVGVFICARALSRGGKNGFHFPASAWSAVGAWMAAIGIGVVSALELTNQADKFQMTACLLGILAAVALFYVGICHHKGTKVNVLAYVAVCVYFMMHLICIYRYWGARPQLFAYCFQLLTVVCAMLATYHRATLAVDAGKCAAYACFSLLTIFFCVICLGKDPMYLGVGLWLFADLSNLTPMPEPVQEAENEAE